MREYLSRFTNNWSVRIEELDLLAQMGSSYQKDLTERAQALLESNDLNAIYFAISQYNTKENLRPLLTKAVDHAIQLTQTDSDQAKMIAQYAQYYFKDMVDILIQSQRVNDAQVFVDQALLAISTTAENDPEMDALWNAKVQALQAAKLSCHDGICEILPAQNSTCDQTLKTK